TNNGNGALDYTTGCTVNGGTLIAAGSAGMAQSVGASSKVYSLTVTLNAQQSAQTLINVTDADGNEVLTYKPSKVYQTVIICSPSLKSGEKYTVYYGGTHSGISENGLMNGGGYSEGTKLDTVTLSSAVTSVGASAGIGMGGQGFGGGIPPGGGKMR
ncbi:MAG: hypothetical protein GX851_00680, partial [Clostridiales bacterium]|nr:hypothetical protein [Clostridiales bacterium]